jgi:phosphoribosylformimino-5-aminoimidazole carboxamide ribonucleotide (ProFAR) isomerase
MHGLSQIHNLNAAAARNEVSAVIKNLVASGHSTLHLVDINGAQDLNSKPLVFDTPEAATEYLKLKIPRTEQTLWVLTTPKN